MTHYFVLLMNIIGLVFLSIFGGENVALRMNVPKEVNAGAEFDVEITFRKGSAESFARFQQELPRGLTAEVIDRSTANFAFEDQKVKFIWLNLPQEKEFKIAYRIKIDERLKGNFDLKGMFSYIESNQRRSVDIIADNISIRPSSRIDPNLIVDISEYQQMVPYQPPVSLLASNVRCIRQTPFYTGYANDMMVNILVNKGSTEKFAKIEEVLPSGYAAEAINARDAIFTFKDQTVKFLWMNLPPEQRFVVSYRLTPDEDTDKTELNLTGTFSFIVNDITQVIDIVQRDVDLSNLDPKHLDNIIASVPASGITSPVVREGVPVSSSYTGADGGKEIQVQYQKIVDKPRYTQKPVELDMSYLLEPEEGVYYRVQIAAGHKLVDIRRYFRQYSIREEIRTEKHEGWFKYSIGSFPEYKEARDYRVKIWNTTTIDDAFVAAYNNGVRITVQEALMITNQKWYR